MSVENDLKKEAGTDLKYLHCYGLACHDLHFVIYRSLLPRYPAIKSFRNSISFADAYLMKHLIIFEDIPSFSFKFACKLASIFRSRHKKCTYIFVEFGCSLWIFYTKVFKRKILFDQIMNFIILFRKYLHSHM